MLLRTSFSFTFFAGAIGEKSRRGNGRDEVIEPRHWTLGDNHLWRKSRKQQREGEGGGLSSFPLLFPPPRRRTRSNWLRREGHARAPDTQASAFERERKGGGTGGGRGRPPDSLVDSPPPSPPLDGQCGLLRVLVLFHRKRNQPPPLVPFLPYSRSTATGSISLSLPSNY